MIEPPVEPAEGPTNMSSSSVIVASGPQTVESALPKPAVVMTDTAWKVPCADGGLAGLVVPGEQLEASRAPSRASAKTRYRRSSSSVASTCSRRWTTTRYMRRKLMPATNIRTSRMYWVTGANAETDALRLEKPPSETTESAWATASNSVIAGSSPVQPVAAAPRSATTVRPDVERPQAAGGLADRLREALDLGRAGQLRLQQLAAADAQARQDRDGEHDDAHAAEPVAELAPEEHRAVEPFDVGEHRRARGGEARDRLEERVDRVRELRQAAEQVRQHAEDGHEQPDQPDHEEALARADRGAGLGAGDLVEQEAGARRDRAAEQERPDRLAVAERDRGGHDVGRSTHFSTPPTRSRALPTSTPSTR